MNIEKRTKITDPLIDHCMNYLYVHIGQNESLKNHEIRECTLHTLMALVVSFIASTLCEDQIKVDMMTEFNEHCSKGLNAYIQVCSENKTIN